MRLMLSLSKSPSLDETCNLLEGNVENSPLCRAIIRILDKTKKAVLVTLTIPPEQQPMARRVQRFLSGPQPEQEQAA